MEEIKTGTCKRCERTLKILSNGLCERCDNVMYGRTEQKIHYPSYNPIYDNPRKKYQKLWC